VCQPLRLRHSTATYSSAQAERSHSAGQHSSAVHRERLAGALQYVGICVRIDRDPRKLADLVIKIEDV
jgi:hypothetical protein